MWRIVTLVLLSMVAMAPQGALASDIAGSDDTDTHLEERLDELDFDFPMPGETKQKKPRPPRIAFSRYRLDLGRMCNLIRNDGRQDYLYQLLLDHAAPDENCIACEKFFRTFASACKPKKPKRAKKGEETHTETVVYHKQREPSLELARRASELFSRMAEDRQREEIAKAVLALAEILKTDSIQTPGERDYFSYIAATIVAPFQEQETAAKSSEPEVSSGNTSPPPNVNDLFE